MPDDPEETPLNRKAFFALEGASLDCIGDIINLLRSSDPIHPIVRERLAEALDGGTVGGARLIMIDHKQTNDIYRHVWSLQRKLEIGLVAQSLIDAGNTTGRAIEITAQRMMASEKLCEAALTFHRKASALADNMETRPEYRRFDRETLLGMAAAQFRQRRKPRDPRPKRRPSRS